jgi:tetratricopeptide (TPR) repeat protein
MAGQSNEYTDDANRATDILFQLRDRIPCNEAVWLINVDNALTNIFLKKNQFRLAMASLDRIVCLIPEAVRDEVETRLSKEISDKERMISCLTKAYTCEILSRQGRILLQAGALFEAAEIFESAKALATDMESSSSTANPLDEISNHDMVRILPCQMDVNEGLFYFSKGHYDHALQSFTKGLTILRNTNNFYATYRTEDWIGPSFAGPQPANMLYNEIVNNMGLCNLYMCNMKDAVDLLEGVVREDPTSFLTERVAFNLCTLYELGSDNQTGVRKKKTLQMIAKRFFLHDIGPENFRVT